MNIEDVDIVVLDAIASEPHGISFNILVKKLRGRVSRVTVVKVLRKLLSLGIISLHRDTRHKQKKIYKVVSKIKRIHVELNLSANDNSDIIAYMKELITRYERLISGEIDDVVKKYAKHKLLKNFQEALEVGLHGKNSLNGG